jgi:molecular chaperone GrpE
MNMHPDSDPKNQEEPIANGDGKLGASSGVASEEEGGELPRDVERLTAEVADLKDRYLRVMAEMDNMRRRQERERADLVKYSLEGLFREFLPALDSFEKALPDASAEGTPAVADKSFHDGMTMVKRQLFEVLKKNGLEPIAAKGEVFDPNKHQAIQRIESAEVQQEIVAEEYARGYTLNGRLKRPSMVSVFIPSGS